MGSNQRLDMLLAAIDEVNRQDPRSIWFDDEPHPYEYVYGLRMSEMQEAFYPGASEALKIASRGQHIARWRIPRSSFPEGRQGYLKWRAKLKIYHADLLSGLMKTHGYEADAVGAVRSLLIKKGLKGDGEAEILEDIVCLVFLKYYLEDFAAQHEEKKVIDILRKTWGKMTKSGQRQALSLDLAEKSQHIVRIALID